MAPDPTRLSRDELARDLVTLGLRPGDHLGLGVSLRAIGRIEGGAPTLTRALLHVVGSSGTIMIPTYTRWYLPAEIDDPRKRTSVFDPATSPSYTGAMAETVRLRPDAVRSRHPTNSVAAVGSMAGYLTRGHDHRAPAYEPFSRLGEISGKLLYIGLGDHMVGMRHQAQHLAGLLAAAEMVCGAEFVDQEGRIRRFVRRDRGGCTTRLPELVPELRRRGHTRDGRVGNAFASLSDAREALEVTADLLRADPRRNLCNDAACEWCRAVEQNLGLG